MKRSGSYICRTRNRDNKNLSVYVFPRLDAKPVDRYEQICMVWSHMTMVSVIFSGPVNP